jgi:hypothetical protein
LKHRKLLRIGIISRFCAHRIESSGINKFRKAHDELSRCDHFRKDLGREAYSSKNTKTSLTMPEVK